MSRNCAWASLNCFSRNLVYGLLARCPVQALSRSTRFLVKAIDVICQIFLLALQIGLHSRSGDHYKPAAGQVSIGTGTT